MPIGGNKIVNIYSKFSKEVKDKIECHDKSHAT